VQPLIALYTDADSLAVGCRDGLTSAVQLIPKLWPFLNHSIRSVRRATLRTMSVLLSTGRLKVYVDVQLSGSVVCVGRNCCFHMWIRPLDVGLYIYMYAVPLNQLLHFMCLRTNERLM